MNSSKIVIYILFVIFITANILHKLVLTRNQHFEVFTNKIRNCTIKPVGWSFDLPDCRAYANTQLIAVSGSQSSDSDNGFFQPKGLTVQSVEEISLSHLSVKRWLMRATIFITHLKQLFLEKGLSFLPTTHAGLISGMVFGGTASLPQELAQDLKVTGLTHVVSASGYNVSIVAGVALILFSRILPRKILPGVTLIVIWGYALAAELVPPVVRAAVMISINLIASRVFLRQYNLMFSLVLTALLMLAGQPFYLTSLSFWLSTLATMGIILILPVLESQQGLLSRLNTGDLQPQSTPAPKPNLLKESLVVTLAAQSLTLPLVAAVFGEISLISFMTNTFLIWLTPIITLLGLGLMIIGVLLGWWVDVWQQLMPVLSLMVWLPTELFMMGVRWFGQFEWGLTKMTLPWWMVWAWWGWWGILIFINRSRARVKKSSSYFSE